MNLPDDWNDDPEKYGTLKIQYKWRLTILNRWKFTCRFVFDGNFSAEQLKTKHPENDVHLSDGHGFFVTAVPYNRHLRVATEIKQVGLRRFLVTSSSHS